MSEQEPLTSQAVDNLNACYIKSFRNFKLGRVLLDALASMHIT